MSLVVNGKVCVFCSLCWTEPAHTFISGYNAPTNLQHYAIYLDTRIRSYRELKHDAIRVQSETNRDLRLSMSLEDDARQNRKFSPGDFQAPGGSKRKTIMGRKLRIMTVEKGLLRETKVVQKLLDALVECRVSHTLMGILSLELTWLHSVLPGRLGGSTNNCGTTNASQGSPYPLSSC